MYAICGVCGGVWSDELIAWDFHWTEHWLSRIMICSARARARIVAGRQCVFIWWENEHMRRIKYLWMTFGHSLPVRICFSLPILSFSICFHFARSNIYVRSIQNERYPLQQLAVLAEFVKVLSNSFLNKFSQKMIYSFVLCAHSLIRSIISETVRATIKIYSENMISIIVNVCCTKRIINWFRIMSVGVCEKFNEEKLNEPHVATYVVYHAAFITLLNH